MLKLLIEVFNLILLSPLFAEKLILTIF